MPAEAYDERPSTMCDHVPDDACGLAYDNHNCDGGWKLVIPEGSIEFKGLASMQKYIDSMDTVGVRTGCTLQLFSNNDFSGKNATINSYIDNERL